MLVQPEQKQIVEAHKKVIAAGQPAEEFEPQKESFNDLIETPADRTYRLRKQLARAKPARQSMSRARRHLLFINPGTEKIRLVRYSLKTGRALPKFCQQGNLGDKFRLVNGKLYFEDQRVLDDEEKRRVVKKLYFDPREGSTVETIWLKARREFANLSKANVKKILGSIEAYQLNHRRRRPPKVLGKMNLRSPGVIAADMFFPSKNLWETAPCLTIMDCWSRYSRVFVLERKTKALTLRCFEKFFREMMSLGHRPRVLLSDRGSEFAGLPNSELFKKWKVTSFHSPTGAPVHIVEALQAQYMRRAEIYRTAGITEKPSHIMHMISEQLNKQPRRQYDNKTPEQLLKLTKAQRKEANAFSDEHKNNLDVIQLKGLPHLVEGNTVRFLTWTRKEQVEGKVKGYSEKWSRSLHKVRKMIRIKQNRDVFKFYISDMPNYFWRHELLKVVGEVDSELPKRSFELKDKMMYEKGSWEKPKASGKPKPKLEKPKPKKIPKSEISEEFILKRPRRKKRVDYAKFFDSP